MNLEAFDSLEVPRPEMLADPEATSLLQWLRMQQSGDRVALYASGSTPGSLFLTAVLVPLDHLARPWEELEEWSGNPFDHPSCGLVWGGDDGARMELNVPWDDDQPPVLQGARQLVFGRSFEGRIGEATYYELAQEITLSHGLHWLDERQAWCRFNNDGDIEDRAGVVHFGPDERSATLIWIDRDLLEHHLAATSTCLAQMFDCAWFSDVHHVRQLQDISTYRDADDSISCKFAIEDNLASFRGVQFIRPRQTARELGEKEFASHRAAKEYETFLIQDIRHDRIVEWSCDPAALASYFDVASDAPFETSPVFFRPEVLDKYKADRQKYRLGERTLSCRNAWSLRTYDVNAAGQLHTYIVYLGNLPLGEQRYWKSFNEAPKAPISERAFQTDFEGRWDTQEDPLRDLKGTVRCLRDASITWFRVKQPELLEELHYPLTSAHKPWDDTIIELAKLIVEGLEHKVLSRISKDRGDGGDPKWGSIKWLRSALLAVGVDEDYANQLVAPIERVQFLRTKLAAHAGNNEASKIRRDLLTEHKTPKVHIAAMAAELNESLTAISQILPP